MKIEASRRLKICAAADEQMARTYLKEVAGVPIGKLEYLGGNQVRFKIETSDLAKAKASLVRYFGPGEQSKVYNSQGMTWRLDAKKVVVLTDDRYGGGVREPSSSIALLDADHKEHIKDMLRRVLGPIKSPKR